MEGVYGGDVAMIGMVEGWLHVGVLRGSAIVEEGGVLAERREEEEG